MSDRRPAGAPSQRPHITFAERTVPRQLPRAHGGSNLASAAGLRFERKFVKALASLAGLSPAQVVHNPWFLFHQTDAAGGYDVPACCCPDVLLTPPAALAKSLGDLIVIEVKLTYVSEALQKLRDLYVPVVRKALTRRLEKDIRPLVVVNKLVPGSPRAAFSVREALALDPPLMQWIGTGPVVL